MPETVLNEEVVEEKSLLSETTEETIEEKVEDGGTEKEKDSQADKSSDGAPESYADFTLPEGMEVDSKMLEAFQPIAKELNLSQDQAQKLVDIQTTQMQKIGEAQTEAFETVVSDWKEAAKNDSEVGGANFQAHIATAMKALKEFGTPELFEALDVTGVGNHPEFLRVFYRIGKLIEDDSVHFGKAKQAPKTAAEILYPSMNK